ncbi:coxI translation CYA5 [Fusarium albosuccineum]|uniref:CoxI translation CYA5 n=1 Tax=Fusarium albosuccineum TaxID=1237068 RepID=A0A8H4PIE0_9HYPO|nr:coxI translation CYA5 [Fusarium albosuccineum]
MLERTAVSLEPRSLQRVIRKSPRRSRQLHTGFWQHGASAIDLANVLPGPSRAPDLVAADSDRAYRPVQSTLVASALVLDFLYPASCIPLLRRIYPRLPATQDGHCKALIPGRRPFSSESSPHTTEATSSASTPLSEAGTPAPSNRDIATDANTQIALESLNGEDESELHSLQRLLDLNEDRYQEAWDLYCVIDHDQRLGVRGRVVQYLAKSHGIVETGRAASIFRQIPADEWDDAVLTAGIILLLRAGDLQAAVESFKMGLDKKGISGGLEYLLADTISSKQWSAALDVWIAYYAGRPESTAQAKPDHQRLQKLRTIPGQGDLYFGFRSYLATDGAEKYKEIKQDGIARLAFRVFRRHFARMALLQPCSLDQATIILETQNDPGLYNEYLVHMLERWYDKKETRATLQKLPAVYRKFRQIPGAVPAMHVLRGMFKLYFPVNTPRLEELYYDWVQLRGGLNQWGYEKFLKLYAYNGDVAMVRSIWDQYVADYPDLLRSPRAFRSTLNVYAQAGDVDGAMEELKNMSDIYSVEPDICAWNTVLKAYMRTNDYDKVLELFDQISMHHEPDSFTYAHVMAMSAKMGDLDTTLEYFKRSQEAGLPIINQMALGLVVAYLQNNLLLEAESLCTEMTTRNLASTAIWNQLLKFNGIEGKIDKVYELLRQMKEMDVEWDDETYEYLLQALVKVNQIHPAYLLLKRAVEDDLFLVTTEHFAVVMAGAARVGEYRLVESLHDRLQRSELPLTFGALVAMASAAVKRQPGAERSKNLAKEFVEHVRRVVEASKGVSQPVTGASGNINAGNINRLRAESRHFGRAIALLVELRELASVEELMSLFVQIFPQFQSGDQFPPDVVSGLMLALYRDEQYKEIMRFWDKTWTSVLASSQKRTGDGIYVRNEYDLVRVLNIVLRTYKEMNDPQGLSDCIDRVTKAGFKLTRATWYLAIRYLGEMGRWDRAMYWCETMLMPAWRGWASQRSGKEKRELRNSGLLKAPRSLVYRLQRHWLEMRKMAAWSEDVSRQLSTVEEKYPRLHHAFTTSEMENIPMTYMINGKEVPLRDLDKVLHSMSHQELIKVQQVFLKQLAKQKKREQGLGLKPASDKLQDVRVWKKTMHDKVRKYAAMWAERRKRQAKSSKLIEPGEIEAEGLAHEDLDQMASREVLGYWDHFWDRYDQQLHGRTGNEIYGDKPKDKPKAVRKPETSW